MRGAGCVRDDLGLHSAPHCSMPVRVIQVNHHMTRVIMNDEKQITETLAFRQISTADNMNLLLPTRTCGSALVGVWSSVLLKLGSLTLASFPEFGLLDWESKTGKCYLVYLNLLEPTRTYSNLRFDLDWRMVECLA